MLGHKNILKVENMFWTVFATWWWITQKYFKIHHSQYWKLYQDGCVTCHLSTQHWICCSWSGWHDGSQVTNLKCHVILRGFSDIQPSTMGFGHEGCHQNNESFWKKKLLAACLGRKNVKRRNLWFLKHPKAFQEIPNSSITFLSPHASSSRGLYNILRHMMLKAEVYGHNGHNTFQTPEFQALKNLN